MEKITKKELIQAIYLDNVEVAKRDVETVVNAVFEKMSEALEKGNICDIFGFGKFEIKERSERAGINPITKEKIVVPASNVVKFRPSKALKEKVNKE